jgi:ribonucleotide monophosphatase NagD (HAD superfamily)
MHGSGIERRVRAMDEQCRRGTIVIDLDGTICEHRYPAFGEPIAGAREALQRLKEAGYWIVIHTVRTSSYYRQVQLYDDDVNSPEVLAAYLQRHDIPFDEIWLHDKPVAMAYIDDRGMRLVGDTKKSNWKEIADTLLLETQPRRVW